ncbi:hypothetical protein OHA72_57175 [Dactylosporangium sp. NBC_01737]|uniref:hypothetical protein n=1 Tax=Dactylosporangium sp. NBC_01737 TaxID=2975959 RepID=UPI002E0EF0D3|nr:hypothetical protein OHA72_57175 [Dactylosporangium sp. NBC_01737]
MVTIHYTAGGAVARAGAVSRSLTQATFAALSAPSVLDTQPWRWRIDEDRIELHADWRRRLADIDPDGRLLLMSCGAALHHTRVALAAEGVGVDVLRFPDSGDPDLLAELRYTGPAERAPGSGALFRAIAVRRSDRRPFAGGYMPGGDLTLLREAAEQVGAAAYTVTGKDLPGSADDTAYVVITTPGAATNDWVTAGEAVSAVLLTAVAAGLATAAVSDVTAIARHGASHQPTADGYPAAAIRVGVAGRVGARPATLPPAAVTPPPGTPESS